MTLPQERIYVCGLGCVADEDDERTPSLKSLVRLLSVFLGAPVEIWSPPQSIKFASRSSSNGREVLLPQLLEIVHRAKPVDAFAVLVLTLDSVVCEMPPIQFRCSVLDISQCGGSLQRACSMAVPALLGLLGLQPCSTWACLHNAPTLSPMPVAAELCPGCLRKLQFSTNFDVPTRYAQLQKAYAKEQGFDTSSQWIAARMCYLCTDGPDFSHESSSQVDAVEAQFSNGEWYPARIIRRGADGDCDVLFEDGIVMENLLSHQVRQTGTAASDTAVWAPAKINKTAGESLALLKAKHKATSRQASQRPRKPTPDYKRCLTVFYSANHPEKVSNIDKLLKSYKGREAALLDAIEEKYGLKKGHITTLTTDDMPVSGMPTQVVA